MRYIFILFVIIFMLSMFGVSKNKKLCMLLLTSMIFSLVLIPGIPIGWANQMVPLFLILSEIGALGTYIRQYKGSIISNYIGIVLLSSFVLIVASPHLHDLSHIRAFVQTELLFKYFIGVYVFCLISSSQDTSSLQRYSFWGIVILTLFGIINYVTKSANVVVSLVGSLDALGTGVSGSDLATHFTDRARSRVQSLFMFPHDYGYMCVITLLFHIYGYAKKLEPRYKFYIVLACCLFGIFMCGCRTVILCAIVGCVVLSLIGFKLGRIFKYSLFAILLLLSLYITIPFVQEQVDSIITVFDTSYEEAGSSSLTGRMMQLGTTMSYVEGHELLGNGYGFFDINL